MTLAQNERSELRINLILAMTIDCANYNGHLVNEVLWKTQC
jgi:hypothetical protein